MLNLFLKVLSLDMIELAFNRFPHVPENKKENCSLSILSKRKEIYGKKEMC